MSKEQIKRLRKTYTAEFFRQNRLAAFLGILCAFVSALLNIVLSWFLQQLIDTANANGNPSRMTFLTFLALGIILIAALVLFIESRSVPRFLRRAMTQYKNQAMKDLLKKNLASFQKESSADYISALTNDAVQIQDTYLVNLFHGIELLLCFFSALALMIFYSPLLTVISIVLCLLPMILSLHQGKRLSSLAQAVSEKNSLYMSQVQDILQGFPVIKSFQAESHVLSLYREGNNQLEHKKEEQSRVSKQIGLLSYVGALTTQLGVSLIGGWMALSSMGLTGGMVLAFTNLMNFVLQPIRELPDLLAKRKAALALVDRLAQRLQENIREKGQPLPQLPGQAPHQVNLQLHQVHYAYEEGKPVLRGLTANLEAEKAYALVGGSGSGKSTLLQLLLGADSSYSGQILFNGKELRELDANAVFGAISLIQQQVFLFNATVEENISLFQEIPEEKLQMVMKEAGLEEFMGEEGRKKLCGENGNLLSGGQKQRISIARSLLRETPILLVDEATSSLDNQTAYQVTQSILNLKTYLRLVVTHRLEEKLLQQYDQILVLKEGKITEKGTFRELMDQKGYFYSLYTISQ
mgnify:CR=1 FL=1